MSSTKENLAAAFAGESQANRRYLAYAIQAEKEGHPQVAKLFRAVAEAETVHAHSHLRVMGGIGSTEENLKEAIAGELHEFKSMYPEMIKVAQQEGQPQAERSFLFANDVEKIHHGLYEKALAHLQEEQKQVEYYSVCTVCGYTLEGEAPDKCPICNALKKVFKRID